MLTTKMRAAIDEAIGYHPDLAEGVLIDELHARGITDSWEISIAKCHFYKKRDELLQAHTHIGPSSKMSRTWVL